MGKIGKLARHAAFFTAIDGNRITIDSPVVNAIEKPWGGGQVYRYNASARLRQVGVENMRAMLYAQLWGGRLSHVRGIAAVFNNVRDGWIRGVVAEHQPSRCDCCISRYGRTLAQTIPLRQYTRLPSR